MFDEDDRPTPVDPLARDPMGQLYQDMAAVLAEQAKHTAYLERIASQSLMLHEEIPKLHKRIDRIVMVQAWLPTAAITLALLVRVLFLR